MKKFLLFGAAALIAASAAAQELVYEIDYSKENWAFYVMGYTPEVVDGVLTSENPLNEDKSGPAWYQYFIADQFKTVAGESYTAVIECKASEQSSMNLNLGWGWGEGEQQGQQITMSTDWSAVKVKYENVGAPAENASSNLVLQPGTCMAKIEIKTVKLYLGDAPESGDTPVVEGKTLDMLPSLSNDAYDAATKTITFGDAWGWVNWWFGEVGDFSEYDSFVLEFEPVSFIAQVMVLYNGDIESQSVQAQPGESKIVVNLDPAGKKSIQQIAIQNSEPGSLTLTAAYFAASAGVNAISSTAVLTGVNNLPGVKVPDSLDEVVAPGLYISNGKKIIKK